MPRPAATDFSYFLYLNGSSVTEPFGGLKFTSSVSGLGVSGCATGQFEFDIYDADGVYTDAIIEGMTAQLIGTEGVSRLYYVSKRQSAKKVCHFTACDAMSKIDDQSIDASALWQAADKDHITVSVVLDAIRSAVGLEGVHLPEAAGVITFTREQLKGKSVRQILETIASTACGVWRADGDNSIRLVLCGAPADAAFSCGKFADIDRQGRLPVGDFYCTNSETGVLVRRTDGRYGAVLSVESPIAAAEDSSVNNADIKAWDRLRGYEYQAWQCEKALADNDAFARAFAPAVIDFDGAKLLAHQITVTCDSSGVYFSGGSAAVEELEYRDRIDRELEERLKIGKIVGNIRITQNGDVVFSNNTKGGGLNGHENGICLFTNNNI